MAIIPTSIENICFDEKSKKLLHKKIIRDDREIMLVKDVLPNLNEKFDFLITSKYFHHAENVLYTEFIRCSPLSAFWNEDKPEEITGGKSYFNYLILIIKKSLDDLQKVTSDRLDRLEFKSFNYNEWLSFFDSNVALFNKFSIDMPSNLQQILGNASNGPSVFNNCDLQCRNFALTIPPDHRAILFDWDLGVQPHNNFTFEPIENLIAYNFILAWDNPEWQKRLVDRFKLKIEKILFQKAVVIKSFNQAYFWKDNPNTNLSRSQLELIQKITDNLYLNNLFN